MKNIIKTALHLVLDVAELQNEFSLRLVERTGVMRAYGRVFLRVTRKLAPNPLLTDAVIERIVQRIVQRSDAQTRRVSTGVLNALRGWVDGETPAFVSVVEAFKETYVQGAEQAVEELVAEQERQGSVVHMN